MTIDELAAESWDAGDIGCGELVLELRARLSRLRPGPILELTALDPGAPADVPAWCRMTGHTLLSQEPPVYRIRREES
jgi:tRNA 2-thiouridine synthesizing protein A